jgi:hypothetical protein
MMAEFILMVAIGSEVGNDSCCLAEHYVGTFNSCVEAHEYIKNHIPETPKETRCLHKEHINLPEDFKHKYIIDSCKIKRDCDGKD